ncbi:DUF3800 domain-containing protein [Cupriavidus gilardii]|nr:DUF3800 domain-containing protein [Cupriavidus gilardii]
MAITIYLDESGCLGWKLDAPYQRGGSSRHFTLAAAIIPDGRESILTRPVRGLYTRRKSALPRVEVGGAFIRGARRLCTRVGKDPQRSCGCPLRCHHRAQRKCKRCVPQSPKWPVQLHGQIVAAGRDG